MMIDIRAHVGHAKLTLRYVQSHTSYLLSKQQHQTQRLHLFSIQKIKKKNILQFRLNKHQKVSNSISTNSMTYSKIHSDE